MPRPPRINPDGGIHHVTNHRAGDDDLFLTDRDRFLFLSLMKEGSQETGVETLEYCLMPNHYHLIVRCPSATLDQFVHHLQGNYARAFNYRHERKGPVFQSRYHNVLITTDEQYQVACRYVNRNPGELGHDIGSYPWSSFASHKNLGGPAHAVVDVEQRMIRAMFGSSEAYAEFVEQPMEADRFTLAGTWRRIEAAEPRPISDELDCLCETVINLTGTTLNGLFIARPGKRNDARQLVTLLAADRFPEHAEELSTYLQYQTLAAYRSVLQRASTRLRKDRQFADLLHSARDSWQFLDRPAA